MARSWSFWIEVFMGGALCFVAWVAWDGYADRRDRNAVQSYLDETDAKVASHFVAQSKPYASQEIHDLFAKKLLYSDEYGKMHVHISVDTMRIMKEKGGFFF